MGRRVALVGSVLVVVGILLMVLFERPLVLGTGTPLQEVGRILLGLLPTLGLLCASVGAVMLALAVTIRYAGHPPVRGYPPALLLGGLGAVVLAEVVRAGLGLAVGGGVGSSAVLGLVMTVAHLGGVLQMVGAALLALWLTGRVTAVPAPATRGVRTERESGSRG